MNEKQSILGWKAKVRTISNPRKRWHVRVVEESAINPTFVKVDGSNAFGKPRWVKRSELECLVKPRKPLQ